MDAITERDEVRFAQIPAEYLGFVSAISLQRGIWFPVLQRLTNVFQGLLGRINRFRLLPFWGSRIGWLEGRFLGGFASSLWNPFGIDHMEVRVVAEPLPVIDVKLLACCDL